PWIVNCAKTGLKMQRPRAECARGLRSDYGSVDRLTASAASPALSDRHRDDRGVVERLGHRAVRIDDEGVGADWQTPRDVEAGVGVLARSERRRDVGTRVAHLCGCG